MCIEIVALKYYENAKKNIKKHNEKTEVKGGRGLLKLLGFIGTICCQSRKINDLDPFAMTDNYSFNAKPREIVSHVYQANSQNI